MRQYLSLKEGECAKTSVRVDSTNFYKNTCVQEKLHSSAVLLVSDDLMKTNAVI